MCNDSPLYVSFFYSPVPHSLSLCAKDSQSAIPIGAAFTWTASTAGEFSSEKIPCCAKYTYVRVLFEGMCVWAHLVNF